MSITGANSPVNKPATSLSPWQRASPVLERRAEQKNPSLDPTKQESVKNISGIHYASLLEKL